MRFGDTTTLAARSRLLGERLVGERLALNISQGEAATRGGLSRGAVQRAESGLGTVDTLLRLLAVYGIVDRLDLVLPDPVPSPTQLLGGARPRQRQRARRHPRPDDHTAGPSVWGDER